MARKTLVIVLGAGASRSCGVPGTKELTDLVDRELPGKTSEKGWVWPADAEPPTGETVSDAFAVRLREVVKEKFADERFAQGYHFENLLGAVEELEDYAWRSTLVSRVTNLPSQNSALDDATLLGAAREGLTKAIHRHIGEAVSRRSVRRHRDAWALRFFLKKLSRRFRLVVIDLNYDDIADGARVRWADGFVRPLGEALLFDPRAWREQVDRGDHLLVHLHGSVRWARLPPTTAWANSPEEPAKYLSYAIAEKYVHGGSSHQSVDGRSYSAPYVISGIGKGPKFIYNLRPYGHYQAALTELVPSADALLFMGYGWGDEHVNALLDESFDMRPEARAAVVTYRSGDDPGSGSRGEQMLQRMAAGEWLKLQTWAYADQPYESTRRSWVGGRIILAPYGFPLDGRTENALLRHLQGRR